MPHKNYVWQKRIKFSSTHSWTKTLELIKSIKYYFLLFKENIASAAQFFLNEFNRANKLSKFEMSFLNTLEWQACVHFAGDVGVVGTMFHYSNTGPIFFTDPYLELWTNVQHNNPDTPTGGGHFVAPKAKAHWVS